MRNDTVEFMPLTGHVGAEVHGVNLREPLDDETFRTLHGGLLEYLVLFFRDQDITFDQHVAFARRFGELHIHPSAPCVDGRPELMKIHADATSPFAEGTAWHSDVSCDEEPPMASILHLSTAPSVGVDTLFANMYAAFDALSETMKKILDPLEALHTADVHRGRYEQVGGGLRRDKHPEAVHPVIRTHPETGRNLIFVNEPFTQGIVGMKRAESDALLAFLYAHCANPQFQCRFRWRTNSIAMWDNRCTQHHVTGTTIPRREAGCGSPSRAIAPFTEAERIRIRRRRRRLTTSSRAGLRAGVLPDGGEQPAARALGVRAAERFRGQKVGERRQSYGNGVRIWLPNP